MYYLRYCLLPFAFLYGAIIFLRNWLYDIKILPCKSAIIPTVVVGNLSMGGTGKTPQIEYLIRLLASRKKIAVLSRGYARKSKGFVLANKHTCVEDLGDEPFQFYQKFPQIPIAVDTNRLLGIEKLLKIDPDIELILLDDAFQYRKLISDFSIVLTCYERLYVDDFLFPVGSLRENKAGAKRANIIVVTKSPFDLTIKEKLKIAKKIKLKPHQFLYFSCIVYDDFISNDKNFKILLSQMIDYQIVLVTGIANPKPLQAFLNKNKISYKHLKFPDHHHFSNRDIKKIQWTYDSLSSRHSLKLVLTTEKDFVRLKNKLSGVYCIRIKNHFLPTQNEFTFDEVLQDFFTKI